MEHAKNAKNQAAANRRLGLILATVALAFALGFVAKLLWLGAGK